MVINATKMNLNSEVDPMCHAELQIYYWKLKYRINIEKTKENKNIKVSQKAQSHFQSANRQKHDAL